jgi:hypothetical protein
MYEVLLTTLAASAYIGALAFRVSVLKARPAASSDAKNPTQTRGVATA